MSAPGSPNIRIAMYMVTLPPGAIRTLSGDTSVLKRRRDVGRDSFAQRRNSRRRGVSMMTVAKRLDRSLDDVRRRWKIRLADAEIDDVLSLRLQRHGARQHRERILLADAIKTCDSVQRHPPSPLI